MLTAIITSIIISIAVTIVWILHDRVSHERLKSKKTPDLVTCIFDQHLADRVTLYVLYGEDVLIVNRLEADLHQPYKSNMPDDRHKGKLLWKQMEFRTVEKLRTLIEYDCSKNSIIPPFLPGGPHYCITIYYSSGAVEERFCERISSELRTELDELLKSHLVELDSIPSVLQNNADLFKEINFYYKDSRCP